MSSTAERNRLWGRLLIEELARHGARHAFVSPGSRNTPVSLAAWENEKISLHVHPDERGSAFAALGCGKATGEPALWITTSGTAVANGHPAAVEADEAGVPLIMLTADRPPELRDTGANQTIRQPGMFGGAVRWQVDLPPPSEHVDPRMVLTTAAQAYHQAVSDPGPVHVNAMFREPLSSGEQAPEIKARGLEDYFNQDVPYTTYRQAIQHVKNDDLDWLADVLRGHSKGVIVIGEQQGSAPGEDAVRLGETLGWPVLPDVLSHVRTGHSDVISCFDLLLSSKQFRQAHAPDAVLHLGGRATSKRLATFLSEANPALYVMVRPDARRIDPKHQVTRRIQTDVSPLCSALLEHTGETEETDWRSGWIEANERVASFLESEFEQEELSEPFIARCIMEEIDASHILFAGSSMPVRDLDAFAATNGSPVSVFANRGASGIDGTVSTAAGVARGRSQPVTLLLGDLALLHDLNGLAFLRSGPPVISVVINNDGGGIFHFLPISEHVPDAFEDLFGTPHGLAFRHAAEMMGLDYHHPTSGPEFRETYRSALEAGRSAVIEVTTDRKENRELHKDILRRVDHVLADV